jgi:hypothetical protein
MGAFSEVEEPIRQTPTTLIVDNYEKTASRGHPQVNIKCELPYNLVLMFYLYHV